MRRRTRSPGSFAANVQSASRRRSGPRFVKVAPVVGSATTAMPGYLLARAIRDALDPTQAPGKVRTMADMTPEELAKLVPPRKL